MLVLQAAVIFLTIFGWPTRDTFCLATESGVACFRQWQPLVAATTALAAALLTIGVALHLGRRQARISDLTAFFKHRLDLYHEVKAKGMEIRGARKVTQEQEDDLFTLHYEAKLLFRKDFSDLVTKLTSASFVIRHADEELVGLSEDSSHYKSQMAKKLEAIDTVREVFRELPEVFKEGYAVLRPEI